MTNTFQTQIIKIGNSNGIRIPKDYLKALGTKHVILELKNDNLTIKPLSKINPPRSKWESILAKMEIEPENDFNDFDITIEDGLDDL